MNELMRTDLKGLDAQEFEEWAISQGLKRYRGRQIREWTFKKLAVSFQGMSNLPQDMRTLLEERASLCPSETVKIQVSKDGTRKLLFQLKDGHIIESVLIPERDHFTICISTQVGCAMGCRFCLTGKHGLKRNMTPGEIMDQVIQVKRSMDEPERLTNVVLMGMGEPLANYNAVTKAMGNLIAGDGMNFSHHKVTLSTCGLVPQIKELGKHITVNLAVSLNAADDKTRSSLMPINRKYPLKQLIQACRAFPLPNRRMITFEYILIKGINDRDEDAVRLVKLLSGMRAKINLIPLNPVPGQELSPPPIEKIQHFRNILIEHHFTAIIRQSKGQDISAACGQLSGDASE
jgi:23S rRNA (adenine2503-C2)-methyltransferase